MSAKPRDISCDDLREMIDDYLTKIGATPEYRAGYLDAQEKSGWLRPSAPAWIRNSAALYYCLPLCKK